MGTAIDGDTAADVEEGRRKQQTPQNSEDDANSARHIVSFSPNGEDDKKSNIDDNNDDSSSSIPQPLYHSTRLKGYIVLFVSACELYSIFDVAYTIIFVMSCIYTDIINFRIPFVTHTPIKVYNFMAAADAGYVGISSNLCLEMDHLGSFVDNMYTNESKLRYAESVSMITM